jgi:hypothetical protein
MKKIFRNVVVFSVAVLVAGVFSACHRGSASAGAMVDVPTTSLNVQNDVNKTLVLKFKQMPQSVTFNGVTYGSSDIKGPDSNGDYYIEVANAKNGTLTVDYGSAYFVETVNVKLGDNEVVELNIPAVKKSSNTQSLAALGGAAGNVTNDSQNQTEDQMNGELDGVQAQIDIPAGVTLTNANGSAYTGSDDFSITVYTPAQSPESESTLTENKSFDCAVLGVRCTPDGAYFSTPVDVKVQIPEVAGYSLKLFNSDKKSETRTITAIGSDWYQASIPHFSSWIYSLNAKITGITTELVQIAGGQLEVAKGGRQAIPYDKDYGYELIGSVPAVVKQFTSILFSASKRTISSSFSFYAPSEGVLDWTVKQNVRTYMFDSNGKTFQVKFYGSVVPEVSFRVPEEPEQPATEPDVPTHNGGGSDSL